MTNQQEAFESAMSEARRLIDQAQCQERPLHERFHLLIAADQMQCQARQILTSGRPNGDVGVAAISAGPVIDVDLMKHRAIEIVSCQPQA